MLARVIGTATCLSVRLSVCPSRAGIVKTKKAIRMISSPSGSPKTLAISPTCLSVYVLCVSQLMASACCELTKPMSVSLSPNGQYVYSVPDKELNSITQCRVVGT